MTNVISSKKRKLSDKEWAEEPLRKSLTNIREAATFVNNAFHIDPDTIPLTPYGRALFSILEELTGDVISRSYIDEKLDVMFEDE